MYWRVYDGDQQAALEKTLAALDEFECSSD